MNLNLDGIAGDIITIVGSILIAIFVIRAVKAYLRRDWGDLVAEVCFILVLGWIAWFPDSFEAFLRAIITRVTGAA